MRQGRGHREDSFGLTFEFFACCRGPGGADRLVGAAILAGFASPDASPRPGLAFMLFLPLAGLICWLWWALNWLLSVAGIFAVRDGEDVVGAISSAVTFLRERSGAVFAVTHGLDWRTLSPSCGFHHCLHCRSAFAPGGHGVCWSPLKILMTLVTSRCRLALHGSSCGICLHRRNAVACWRRSLSRLPRSVRHRPRSTAATDLSDIPNLAERR